MEKKFLKYLMIAIIFFIGLSLGVNYRENNRPQQVQDELDDFEDKITQPNNNYGSDFKPINPIGKSKNEHNSEVNTEIKDNAFTTLGKDGENVIKRILDGIVNSSGDLFRSIFQK